MKIRLIMPGLAALLLLISACVPPLNLRNDKFLNDDSLITMQPCDAPCWRGITPGVTKWDDALTILEDSPDLAKPDVQKEDNGPGVGALWQPKDGESCCQMASLDGDTVSVILLRLAPNITRSKLIDARGEPTYALGAPGDEEQAVINLFYPDNSLIATVFVAGDKNGVLSETSEVIGAYYVAPDQMQLILETNSLYGWKGYQPFSAYAPDAENADFVITPSVTLTPTASQ
jgi:hypothetical protein